MQILLMFAVLAVFFLPRGEAPVSAPGYRIAAIVTGATVVCIMAWVEAGLVSRALRREPSRLRGIVRRYRWARTAHLFLLLGVWAGTTFGLQWSRIVYFNWALSGTVLVDDLLLLAPLVVPLAVSWAGFFEVDRTMRKFAAAPNAVWSRWEYVEYHLRHTFGIFLIPLLVLLGALDLMAIFFPSATPGQGGVLLGALLLAMALGFPFLLRLVWKAKPLADGPLRRRLQRLGQRAGFRARDILVWDTRGAVANAAVAGFLPRFRYVFISDGLLRDFTGSEIEAVFGHEVGHVKHAHLTLRIASFLPLWGLIALLENQMPPGSLSDWGALDAWLPAAVRHMMLMGFYLLAVFGYLSRRLERQADLFGCRLTSCGEAACACHDESEADRRPARAPGTVCPTSIGTFVGMLEKLADFNGLNRNAPSWQHFSIARRIRFLESLLADPRAEQRFHYSLRRLRTLLGLSTIVLFVLAGWSWMH